jgi:chromosome partitioning protein
VLASAARGPIIRSVLTIAVINQKGGVGKTTTVANLGAAVAARGCRTCLIDLDPQAHLTLHFNVESGRNGPTVYDVLTGGSDFASACVDVDETLTVVPSEIDLAAAEVELAATVGRELILRDAIRQRPMPHQMVMIDCPPSLGLLTLNALAAADEVLIPLQPHFLALQGLGKLLETVSLVQRRINPGLRVGGVMLCMYETATRLAAEVVADLQGFFDAARGTACPWSDVRIFQTVIRRNVKLAECPSHGMTIFQYDAASNGASDYRHLADEFAEHYGRLFQPAAGADSAAETPPAPHAEEIPEAQAGGEVLGATPDEPAVETAGEPAADVAAFEAESPPLAGQATAEPPDVQSADPPAHGPNP